MHADLDALVAGINVGTANNVSPLVQKVHHLLDVALLIIDGLVLLKYKRYVPNCTTAAGCLHAHACML